MLELELHLEMSRDDISRGKNLEKKKSQEKYLENFEISRYIRSTVKILIKRGKGTLVEIYSETHYEIYIISH